MEFLDKVVQFLVRMLKAVRQFLWPIYGREHQMFVPMALMIALILFNYTMLRGVKDALVVTNTGAETITFLKVWMVVPAAFIFFLIYSKLSNLLPKKALFNTIVGGFLVFFGLFAFVLYPNRDALHPIEFTNQLQAMLPAGALGNFLKGIILMFRYWTDSLFYTMAELWGSAVLTLMFWQFANDITKVSLAKRFYAHFYLVGNMAVVLAGYVQKLFSDMQDRVAPGVDPWGVSLNYLMTIVVLAGVGVLGLYFYINKFVLEPEAAAAELAGEQKPKKKKLKMSIGESIKFLLNSPYLGLIALLVICYGISINLVEVAWKNQVKLQYPTASAYSTFMGTYFMLTGIMTIIAIFIGSSVLRKFGWKVAAMATPIMLGVTGVLFFMCMIFPDMLSPITAMFGTTPLMLSVLFGLIQNLLSKPTKYALFDPTKEMSYIPLDDESKMKGKAAVDVVGARLGKSGGAFLQQGMFSLIGPVVVFAPYSAAIVIGIVCLWIWAVAALHKRFVAASGTEV